MKRSQFEYGEEKLDTVAKLWGVTPEQAVRILRGRELQWFFEWVNAGEFLDTKCHVLEIDIPAPA